MISHFNWIELIPDGSELDISKHEALCRSFAVGAKRLLRASCCKGVLLVCQALLFCVPILKWNNIRLTLVTFTFIFSPLFL